MNFDLYGFGPALAAGALMTVKLALTALCLGLVLGLAGALAKTSPYKPLQWLGGSYSTLVRGIPELLWVLLIYFGTVNLMRSLGEFFGNPDLSLSAFAAGVIALGLCFGAYATEVFRGAILAIPKGHREAGVALGLSKVRIFTRLIMPQMWRIALPGLGNLFMILMKDTALVSVIGLEEIMRHAQIGVTVTKQPFTFFMVAAFMYLGLTVLAMTGMHFLEKRAARGFARSTWLSHFDLGLNWAVIIKWLPKLAQGATLTLELVAIAVIAGLLLAIPLGIARSSRLWYVRTLPYCYIFFFRGTPLLVQLFLVYYGLAQFDAVRESFMWPYLRDPFWCATATMTLHTAAYIAEILRGAIQAIPPGEIEAARALGMSRPKALFYIILPRAARIGLPAYSNEVILMLKASALASTVTLLELTGMARTIIRSSSLPGCSTC
eukprot:gene8195-9641_t